MKPSRRTLLMLGFLLGLGLLGWWKQDWLIARIYLLILEDEGRIRSLRIEQIIEVLKMVDGTVVADIGAGTGILARPFARAVAPRGRVYAVDVNRELLDHLRETASEQRLPNLLVVEGTELESNLPELVDVAIFCDVLHHIDDPRAYLKNLLRSLKPSGRLAVIDFREGQSPHLTQAMRLGAATVENWARAAGFKLVAEYDFIADNFFLVFEISDDGD